MLVIGMSSGPAYRGDAARALYEDLQVRFSALPGVQSVSLHHGHTAWRRAVDERSRTLLARPSARRRGRAAGVHNVGPRFFETMGYGPGGRDFEPGDDERAPKCVIVSECGPTIAPGEDPLGRQILFGRAPASIVGVVRDVRYTSLRAEAPLVTYRPYRQETMAPANTF